MKITENQIRKIIRSELKAGAENRRLDEFTGIKAALTQIFKGLGGLISAGFSTAKGSYNPGDFKVSYENPYPNKSAESLSPKTDAYDQVYALSRVLWHIDTAIMLGVQSTGFALKKLQALEFPVEPDDQSFSETLEEATEDVSQAAGYFSEYLSRAGSSKVSEIGAGLEPGQSLTETLESFAEAVSAVEALNPVNDWETILKSKAVATIMEGDDEKSESLKNLVNETKGSNMQNIDKVGELKSAIDEINTIAKQAEQVMDVAADEAGEKPEDSALLDHRDRILRVMIREILS